MYTKFDGNEAAPINRLPEDVLRLIFTTLCNAQDPGVASREAVSLSHVCSYWRAVALSDTALWARVDILNTNKKMIRLALKRSRSRPVAIDLSYSGVPRRPVDMDLLRRQWHRVKEFSTLR